MPQLIWCKALYWGGHFAISEEKVKPWAKSHILVVFMVELQMLNPEVGSPRFKNKLFKNAYEVKFDISLIL